MLAEDDPPRLGDPVKPPRSVRCRLWTPDDGVNRVLVVTAHPDDVDFGAAGTSPP